MFEKIKIPITIIAVVFLLSSTIFFSTNLLKDEEEKLEYFTSYIEKVMNLWEVPGIAFGIVDSSGNTYTHGFGVRNLETGGNVDENTVFQIGSTTKAFTSFLIGKLIEDSVINWNDKVKEHVSNFELSDKKVTEEFLINDLMVHHSGMPQNAGDLMGILGLSRDEIINNMKFIELKHKFRCDFSYVNNLFTVAEKIIEEKTGKSYEENLKNRIFDKLDMKNSSVGNETFLYGDNVVSTYSRVHFKDNKGEKDYYFEFDPDSFLFKNSPYNFKAAGGINSNISDMLKWILMHLNKGKYRSTQIIDTKILEYLYKPQSIISMDSNTSSCYAQGWEVVETINGLIINHNGTTDGCESYVGFMPEYGIGIVFLSNLTTPVDVTTILANDFFNLYVRGEKSEIALKVFEVYDHKKMEDLSCNYQIKDPKLYTGTYTNDFYKEVKFIYEEGKHSLIIGPHNTKFNCIPQSENSFKITCLEFGSTVLGNMTFKNLKESEKTVMKIDFSDEEGTGDFKKIH